MSRKISKSTHASKIPYKLTAIAKFALVLQFVAVNCNNGKAQGFYCVLERSCTHFLL